jgi:hypothetical protein
VESCDDRAHGHQNLTSPIDSNQHHNLSIAPPISTSTTTTTTKMVSITILAELLTNLLDYFYGVDEETRVRDDFGGERIQRVT